MNRRSGLWPALALILVLASVLGYLSAPDFLGFTVVPLILAAALAALSGRQAWGRLGRAFSSPLGRGRLWAGLALMASLALALAVGRLNVLPTLDFSRDRTRSLAPETLDLLARLDQPVRITVHMGPQSPRQGLVRELMAH